MKQLILNSLKTKFEGVSENILNRIADKLAKTVSKEDDVQSAVDAVTVQQVIDSEADRRATEASQTAVVNYEKKHSLKEGKPVDGGEQGTKTEPDKKEAPDGDGDKVTAASIAAAVAAAIKPLSDDINALKSGKISDERKQKLDAVIGKLSKSLQKPYSRIPLTDMAEDEFNTFITETKAEVDALVADFAVKESVLGIPVGGKGGNKEPSNEEAAKVVEGII